MEKILITGSSGQVGSYLVEHFSERYDVIGLDIKNSGISEVDTLTIRGDIRDKNVVNKVVNKVDIIIHTAAQLDINRSLENPILDADINIMGTLNLLNAARENKNISKFIYFGSAAVYGHPKYLPIDENHKVDPVSPYGLSKLTGEKYCFLFNKIFDVPVVSIRPFNIYGNRENPSSSYASIITKFVDAAERNKPLIIYGSGKQLRDFVYVEDVVSFVEIVMERNDTVGEIYNLGSGQPTTILDVAKLVLKISGKSEETAILHKKEEKGKINHSYADIKKSKEIGYIPKVSIEKGINKVIKSYKVNEIGNF